VTPHDLLHTPCPTPDALHAWVRLFLGLRIPRTAACDEHDAPFDYLVRSYFEPGRDLVVWAPRGGGKTRLAAAATLLDLLHKPGTHVRVLGGSLDQSMRLWEHLLPDLLRLAKFAGKPPTMSSRVVRLANGSTAAALPQSQRAVRGLRVQKLRCDEVDEFDPDVWEAAQLATRSTDRAAAAVEAVSTYHRADGLMGRVVDAARARGTPVLRWCVLDVLQQCELDRPCEPCPLLPECGGRAKTQCSGFLSIDDAVTMKGRVSKQTWESEMLCRRPSARGCVFSGFDEMTHVAKYDAMRDDEVVVGLDFGYAAPLAAVWIAICGRSLHVVDEYVVAGRTLPAHVAAMQATSWPVGRLFCDPAGAAVSGQTGRSDLSVLRDAGWHVRARGSRIVEGVELIRRLLYPADGSPPRLRIDPRCTTLLAAMRGYRYRAEGGETPLKDGVHDHVVDALRYAVVHLHGGASRARSKAY
jgi:hypothetical protein